MTTHEQLDYWRHVQLRLMTTHEELRLLTTHEKLRLLMTQVTQFLSSETGAHIAGVVPWRLRAPIPPARWHTLTGPAPHVIQVATTAVRSFDTSPEILKSRTTNFARWRPISSA
jgi:hypothetical protein